MHRPPLAYRLLLPSSIQWSLQIIEGRKRIALSFDDGPHPETTPALLEMLATHNVKATFFCLGRQAQMHPDLLKAIRAAGHAVGNHGFEHLDGWKTGIAAYTENVKKGSDLLETKLFRPPYGRIWPYQARRLAKEYKLLMWSLLPYDFSPKVTPNACLNTLVDESREGDIVVLHDSPAGIGRILPILPQYLDFLKQGSYFFDLCGLTNEH